MKFYIASSFKLLDKVKLLSHIFEGEGHEITLKWWDRAFDTPTEGPVHTTELKKRYESLTNEEFYSRPECKIAYETDFQAIKDCNVLIMVADDKPRKYNGANIEIGMALALEKPVVSVGVLDNSAMYYPVIQCSTFGELLSALEGVLV